MKILACIFILFHAYKVKYMKEIIADGNYIDEYVTKHKVPPVGQHKFKLVQEIVVLEIFYYTWLIVGMFIYPSWALTFAFLLAISARVLSIETNVTNYRIASIFSIFIIACKVIMT